MVGNLYPFPLSSKRLFVLCVQSIFLTPVPILPSSLACIHVYIHVGLRFFPDASFSSSSPLYIDSPYSCVALSVCASPSTVVLDVCTSSSFVVLDVCASSSSVDSVVCPSSSSSPLPSAVPPHRGVGVSLRCRAGLSLRCRLVLSIFFRVRVLTLRCRVCISLRSRVCLLTIRSLVGLLMIALAVMLGHQPLTKSLVPLTAHIRARQLRAYNPRVQ